MSINNNACSTDYSNISFMGIFVCCSDLYNSSLDLNNVRYGNIYVCLQQYICVLVCYECVSANDINVLSEYI